MTEHRDKVLRDRGLVVWVGDHSREGSGGLRLCLSRACLNERHRSSEVIRGLQRAIREPSEGHQKATEVLRSHQHTFLEERHERRYATRRSDGHSVAVKLGL